MVGFDRSSRQSFKRYRVTPFKQARRQIGRALVVNQRHRVADARLRIRLTVGTVGIEVSVIGLDEFSIEK